MTGVEVIRWPADRDRLDALVDSQVPRLVVVDDGVDPPLTPDCCAEWMWQSGGEREFRLRMRQLALRGLQHRRLEPHVDELGLLHFGLRTVALPPKERQLLGLLLDRSGQFVSRSELTRWAWTGQETSRSAFATAMAKLRARIAGIGLTIRNTDAGYRLEPARALEQPPDQTDMFDDELEAHWRAVVDRRPPASVPENGANNAPEPPSRRSDPAGARGS